MLQAAGWFVIFGRIRRVIGGPFGFPAILAGLMAGFGKLEQSRDAYPAGQQVLHEGGFQGAEFL
jgi:hypothetical protein